MDIELLAYTASQALSSRLYYPCVLAVSPDPSILERTAAELAAQTHWPHLRVGHLLPESLQSVPPRNRGATAERLLLDKVADLRPGPLVCSDLAFLFEPQFALDPLALLRNCSRQAPLIAFWPGTFAPGILAYAVPEHAHYATWTQTELCAGCILTL